MWDGSLLQIVPNIKVAVPRDGTRLTELLREAVAVSDGPTALRFPRGSAPDDLPAIGKLGGMDLLAAPAEGTGQDVLLLAVGPMAAVAMDVAGRLTGQGIGVTVVDPRWVKPVDEAIGKAAAHHRLVVTVEDNGTAGGLGDAVARALREAGISTPLRTFGLPQRFLEHGERGEVLALAGLTSQQLSRDITEAVAKLTADLVPDRQD
jgi:1-deoxy-D-xylulose-5-phosphate synthase